MKKDFQPDWRSLRQHATPQWFKDAKFGIYAHWGVYSVPACGPLAVWYGYCMYKEGKAQFDYHRNNYGPQSKFGYKDLIPLFKAEKFDAEEWAELFKKAGAQFAGPVGEHHDGFAMWDSKVNRWNSAKMGPKRDVVGELEKAVRAQGMKFMVALHHAENWWFYPHWNKESDLADPAFSDLYGPVHNVGRPPSAEIGFFDQDKPSREYLERWKSQTIEVIDKYAPDMLWFDFGLIGIHERYKKDVLAYYYDKAAGSGKDVAFTYKYYDLVPGSAVLDIEGGRMGELVPHDWLTDTSIDAHGNWSYVPNAALKSATAIVHNLVDNVSKNGCLLLSLDPPASGEIIEAEKQCLLDIGKWLEINGEAIYSTTPWMTYGEGPTKMKKTGALSESEEVQYTGQDIRFTAKGDSLYAICLGWPGQEVKIKSVQWIYPSEIESVRMLGCDRNLPWSFTPEGLTVKAPDERPCDHAYVFKISRKSPF